MRCRPERARLFLASLGRPRREPLQVVPRHLQEVLLGETVAAPAVLAPQERVAELPPVGEPAPPEERRVEELRSGRVPAR